MTVPTVYDDLFKARFHFIHGDEQVLLDLVQSLDVSIEPHGGTGRCVVMTPKGRGLQVAIYIDGHWGLTTPEALSTIAHEAVHAALGVFETIGVDRAQLAATSDEFLAYYTEWIVRAFLRAVGAVKGKGKK